MASKKATQEKGKKAAAKSVPAKKEVTTVAKKPSKSAEAIEFMKEVILKEKITRKELLNRTTEKFPDLAKSTISTILSDGKNPKYNRYFPTLLTVDENQILKFQ